MVSQDWHVKIKAARSEGVRGAAFSILVTSCNQCLASTCAGVNVYMRNAFDPSDGKCIYELVAVDL